MIEETIEEQRVALHSRKWQLAKDLLEGSDGVGRLDTQALLFVLQGEISDKRDKIFGAGGIEPFTGEASEQ